MKLIGLTGRVHTPDGKFLTTIGAGKDTVAGFMMECFSDAEACALADPIKQMLSVLPMMEMHKWTDREWKEAVHPLFGVTRRHMARTLGTEWRNLIHRDLWILVLAQRIDHLASAIRPPDAVIITDIRFEHEAEWLRSAGGTVVHVKREADAEPEGTAHSSELGVEPGSGDVYLPNYDDLGELRRKSHFLVEVLK